MCDAGGIILWPQLWLNLIVKPSHYDAAVSIFHGSSVFITAERKSDLGAALGTADISTHGIISRCNYLVRCIPHISDLLHPW